MDNKKAQQLTRSQSILQNIDSLIAHDTLNINLDTQRVLPHNNVGKLYDIIAENEGADGGRTDAFEDLKRTGVVAEQDSKMRKVADQHLRS